MSGSSPSVARDPQHEARALAAKIHLLDGALHRDDADAVEHRRRHARRTPARHRHATEQGRRRDKTEARAAMMACQPGEDREREAEPGAEQQVRLAVCAEVEHDAGAHRDRHPQEEAAVVRLGLDRRPQRLRGACRYAAQPGRDTAGSGGSSASQRGAGSVAHRSSPERARMAGFEPLT